VNTVLHHQRLEATLSPKISGRSFMNCENNTGPRTLLPWTTPIGSLQQLFSISLHHRNTMTDIQTSFSK